MIVNSICVCGAGTMGSGIAQVAAQSGFSVFLYELNPSTLELARNSIDKNLQSLTDKNKMTGGEKEKIMKRITFTGDIHVCRADVYIEAIIEKADAKIALFDQLESLNDGPCIFATNTSSLSIERIASRIRNPERFAGMHFFNPPTLMKLVEVVSSSYTSGDTTRVICELARRMDKTPVLCKDSPGFIVNRVARPYYIESLRLAEEGHSMLQIDSLLEASGFRMGPFRLMDLIGNDINYAVSYAVYEELGKPDRLRPSEIQREKVDRKELGKKSGKGYYSYS
jgi:3-hydroxybutyryl-CoA dehydrogenase